MQDYLDFARRGKNAWWRYLLAVPTALVFTLAISAVLILPLAMTHVIGPDFQENIQQSGSPAFFVATGLSFGILILAFAAAIALWHRKTPMDLIGRWRWRAFGTGLVVWLGVLIVFTGIDVALAPHGFAAAFSADTPRLILLVTPALLVQTFAEEFVFRGYVNQGLLLALKKPLAAAIVSGLLFGALHIPNGLPQAAFAVVFGAALAMIAMRTGGIAFGFGMHLVNNLFGAVVVVSGDDVFHGAAGFFVQNTPQLIWWDMVSGALAGVAVAVLVWRRKDEAISAA